MSGKWNHNICAECWNRRNPDLEAVALISGYVETCCWCSKVNENGIYLRHDPKDPILQCSQGERHADP